MKDSDRAYESIINKLIGGDLLCGQPVDEQALRDELGIGKTPMREAFVRLTQEGYFTALPHRGVFVAAVTTEQLNAIFNVRMSLTPYLCDCILMNALSEKVEELEEEMNGLIEDAKSSRTKAKVMRMDYRFHRMLGELSANSVLDSVLSKMELLSSIALMPRVANMYIKTVDVEGEYRLCFKYIHERNAEGLKDTLFKHLPFNALQF